MSKKNEKRAVSFRLSRQAIGLLEQYSRDNNITKTETIERAIKALCREGNTPATQQDLAALTAIMREGFRETRAAIEQQPIAAIETRDAKPWWQRLFG